MLVEHDQATTAQLAHGRSRMPGRSQLPYYELPYATNALLRTVLVRIAFRRTVLQPVQRLRGAVHAPLRAGSAVKRGGVQKSVTARNVEP